jgi:glycosyltransferase involved in cell wall biosynthesis
MISVIMCTHNPRVPFIARALGALEAQTLPQNEWELILIDNASDERLDQRLDLSWHSKSKIIREDELGLTPARLRGIRDSCGGVLVFVDDDNILAPDYLEKVKEVAEGQQHLGAWSGSVAPEFDAPPPEWTRRYWGNLVIREVTRDNWSNIHFFDETMPLGAGLCVRRMAANEYLRLHEEGQRTRMLDRAGKSLVSGGDNDLAACAIDVGLACGVISSLRLTHIIPSERLSEDYLLRLIEGVAYSSVILRSFRDETRQPRPRKSAAGKAADLLRKARMNERERRFHAAVERGENRARRELETS